jgi:hypothetical protein
MECEWLMCCNKGNTGAQEVDVRCSVWNFSRMKVMGICAGCCCKVVTTVRSEDEYVRLGRCRGYG